MNGSILRIKLNKKFHDKGTRAAGVAARIYLLDLLKKHPVIEIDLIDVYMTPSFADECIGILAKELGKDQFINRVIIKNVSTAIESLLNHVISRRLLENEKT